MVKIVSGQLLTKVTIKLKRMKSKKYPVSKGNSWMLGIFYSRIKQKSPTEKMPPSGIVYLITTFMPVSRVCLLAVFCCV